MGRLIRLLLNLSVECYQMQYEENYLSLYAV